MKKRSIAIILFLLLGLPLLGVFLFGIPVADYLEFPPRTMHVEHAPFSWPVFIAMACGILAVVLPVVIRVIFSRKKCSNAAPKGKVPFPWWGWAGVGLGAAAWVLAWTRFDWFAAFQLYTYIPLWLSYIIVVNALTLRRTGRCMLSHCTGRFLALFPLSAAFWWFFEYLNRFVQNWYYTACDHFSATQYFLTATLSFSTVLPAVLSSEELLSSFPRLTAGLERGPALQLKRPRIAGAVGLLLSSVGLLLIGRFPDQLYPLLWVAPLLLIVSSQAFAKEDSCTFWGLNNGDWRRFVRLCLAALVCGFFWEMWNWHSLAKWIYTVPYVGRFQLFEMPILGYAGYLPFGLECAVIADLLWRHKKAREKSNTCRK